MTIINDPENKKTIDTETGIFLNYVDSRGRDRIRYLSLVDGDREMHFSVEYEIDGPEVPQKRTYIDVRVGHEFANMKEFWFYFKKFNKLLLEFQWMYGPGDGTVVFEIGYEKPKKVVIKGRGLVNV